jgi:mycofactocin precursor
MRDADPATEGTTREEEPAADSQPGEAEADAELVEADLLVEDVSIDGMCGVY